MNNLKRFAVKGIIKELEEVEKELCKNAWQIWNSINNDILEKLNYEEDEAYSEKRNNYDMCRELIHPYLCILRRPANYVAEIIQKIQKQLSNK